MTDRPIIFSAPMVRALLDGRKTQTRRILKPQPVPFLVDDKPCEVALEHYADYPLPRVRLGRVITKQEVRYAVGDRLFVRENHRLTDCECTEACRGPGHVWYEADSSGYRNVAGNKLRPSIHMPRWASRLTLAVTGVKVERLQEISEADAIAEGADPIIDHGTGSTPYLHRIGFEHLWCRINGETAWIENPFVVAVTFQVIKANVDASEALAA